MFEDKFNLWAVVMMRMMKAIGGGDGGIYVDRCRYTLISHPLHGPLRGILILPTVTELQLFSITLVRSWFSSTAFRTAHNCEA